MKLLIDSTPIVVGGGVQVVVAFLVNLMSCPEIDWRAVVPAALRRALPPKVAADPRLRFVDNGSLPKKAALRFRLQAIERGFAPDVVFTVFGPPLFRARAPHVVGFALPHMIFDAETSPTHGFRVSRPADWLRCLLFRQADHLIVETGTAARRFALRLGIDPATISVIGNSVNPLLLGRPAPPPPGDPRFAFLIPSAYYPHKNLEIVPEVAAAMRARAPDLDVAFRFTLDPASAAWQALSATAGRLGVADRIEALGVLDLGRLAQAYEAASAVFLPTLREVSSAVYPESFLLRRPLATSDLDFARDLCGEAALFVPPRDPEAIAERLVALARDPDQRAALVRAGARRLRSGYPTTAEKFAQQIAVLRGVADRGGAFAALGASAAARPAAADAPSGGSAGRAGADAGGRAAFFARTVLTSGILDPSAGPSGSWLDVGCGSGGAARALAARGASVTGIDGSGAAIRTAIALLRDAGLGDRAAFTALDRLMPLPFPDAAFAGCVGLAVLEDVAAPYAALDEMVRVLRPGGHLVLAVPNRHAGLRVARRALRALSRSGGPVPPDRADRSGFAVTETRFRASLRIRGIRPLTVAAYDPVLPAGLAGLAGTRVAGLLFFSGIKESP